MKIKALLKQNVRNARAFLQIEDVGEIRSGAYQLDGVMTVVKVMLCPPHSLGKTPIAALERDHLFSKTETVGPGFIKNFLNHGWLFQQPECACWDDRLGIARGEPQRIVVDYFAPDAAKVMPGSENVERM